MIFVGGKKGHAAFVWCEELGILDYPCSPLVSRHSCEMKRFDESSVSVCVMDLNRAGRQGIALEQRPLASFTVHFHEVELPSQHREVETAENGLNVPSVSRSVLPQQFHVLLVWFDADYFLRSMREEEEC